MAHLTWSPEALTDLENIRDSHRAIDEPLAWRIVETIRAKTLRLIDFPLSARRLGTTAKRKLSVVRYPYVVIHRVTGDDVRILRVRHTSEDWLRR